MTTFIDDLSRSNARNDCYACLAAFPVAIDQMRSAQDVVRIVDLMTKDTKACFERFVGESGDMKQLAIPAIDMFYQRIAELDLLDKYTEAYCAIVVREFFNQLSVYGVTAFYILDNTLRMDRFRAVLKLFGLAGIRSVTPHTQGTNWEELKGEVALRVKNKQHVAYIEPDATVNYLEAAISLARTLPCVATYRNLAPQDSRIQILNLGE